MDIHGTGRNITCNNWFSSTPFADQILKDHNLTFVGTLRHNKTKIPLSFLTDKRKPVHSSQFASSNKTMLMSYTPKKRRCVLMISNMHDRPEVNPQTKKPTIIEFYNSTKGGVDTFDKMVHAYSVSRATRCWPLRMFYGILDQASVNSLVLHRKSTKTDQILRRQFVKTLDFN